MQRPEALAPRQPLVPMPPTNEQPIYSNTFRCFTTYNFYSSMLVQLRDVCTQIDGCAEQARDQVWGQIFSLVGLSKPGPCYQNFSPILARWLEYPTMNITAIELMYLAFGTAMVKNPMLLQPSTSRPLPPSQQTQQLKQQQQQQQTFAQQQFVKQQQLLLQQQQLQQQQPVPTPQFHTPQAKQPIPQRPIPPYTAPHIPPRNSMDAPPFQPISQPIGLQTPPQTQVPTSVSLTPTMSSRLVKPTAIKATLPQTNPSLNPIVSPHDQVERKPQIPPVAPQSPQKQQQQEEEGDAIKHGVGNQEPQKTTTTTTTQSTGPHEEQLRTLIEWSKLLDELSESGKNSLWSTCSSVPGFSAKEHFSKVPFEKLFDFWNENLSTSAVS